MANLVTYVSVFDDKGLVHSFGPDDTVPDWALARITNPAVWDHAPQVSDGGPPPQGGAGASRQVWADWAESHSVAVETDWKRDDIIAACEKAGVPV